MAATASAAHLKGLDLGTSRIVLAELHGEHTNFEVQLNAFVTLPLSNMTKSMLEREGILHFVEDSEIIAYGNRVDEFANMLSGDTQRPMQTGLLNAAEPRSLQIVELAIENICGPARKGEKITFSVPSATPESESDLIYHQQAITQILESLGYKVQSVNEGLAVVYSELIGANFTGFGISFGAGLCNVCFAHLGLPVLTFCMTRVGNYIDRCAASVTGETLTNIRLYKERDFSLTEVTSDNVDQALSVYYDDVIQGVVKGIEREPADVPRRPVRRPTPAHPPPPRSAARWRPRSRRLGPAAGRLVAPWLAGSSPRRSICGLALRQMSRSDIIAKTPVVNFAQTLTRRLPHMRALPTSTE